MTDVTSMLISLFVGGLIGRWGTLAVEKERLVFERRVEFVSRFLWKATKYTSEHISGAVKPPENIGEQKQELVRLSHQTRLLVPDRLDDEIGEWMRQYLEALDTYVAAPLEHPQRYEAAENLNEDLTALRDDLKRFVSGSWLGVRLRAIVAWVETNWVPLLAAAVLSAAGYLLTS